MAKGYVVKEPFSRRDPDTGVMRSFSRGQIISDQKIVAEISGSEHDHHVISTTVPDQSDSPPAEIQE